MHMTYCAPAVVLACVTGQKGRAPLSLQGHANDIVAAMLRRIEQKSLPNWPTVFIERMEHLEPLTNETMPRRMSCVRVIKSFTRFGAGLFSNIEPIS